MSRCSCRSAATTWRWESSTRGAVVSAADAQRMLDTFAAVLAWWGVRPAAPVASLAPVDDAGHDLVGPTPPRSRATVLHEIVEWCAATPDRVAVIDASGRSLSYHELLTRALVTADGLDIDRRLVGVCAGRSVDVVVAMLAAQLAGAGYVPLDPASPAERLASILDAVELSAVLADDDNRGRFATPVPIATGSLHGPDEAVAAARRRLGDVRADDTAYVIFTSGSTGRPRGVVVSHANLAASTAARRVTYDDVPARFLLTSSIGFDSSIVGLFWPLVSGGTIVLPGDDDVHDVDRLAGIIGRHSVTHLLMVPSLYRALLMRGGDNLGSLRTAIVAGEACSPDVAALHRETLGSTPLFDEYGPTEATVWSSVHRVTADDQISIPIGRPIAGANVARGRSKRCSNAGRGCGRAADRGRDRHGGLPGRSRGDCSALRRCRRLALVPHWRPGSRRRRWRHPLPRAGGRPTERRWGSYRARRDRSRVDVAARYCRHRRGRVGTDARTHGRPRRSGQHRRIRAASPSRRRTPDDARTEPDRCALPSATDRARQARSQCCRRPPG